MSELELVGLDEDGEHIVLAAPGGARFRLRIDEPLRAAVRRDRPQLEQLRVESAGTLSPREIQARIRAGATAQEVADSAGLSVAHVQRFEGPVLAEREYVAEQARGTRVGRDVGAPSLGDLVTDRLAVRGVDLGSLAWDAAREGNGPWTVLARFTVADAATEARWTFDLASRGLVALDDEARWLSETELPEEPVARRHLAAVRDVVYDVRADGSTHPLEVGDAPEPDPQEQTQALLDDLHSRRGVRQSLDLGLEEDEGEEFDGFGPRRAWDLSHLDSEVPGAHPVDADPHAEALVLPVPVRPEGDRGTGDPAAAGADTPAGPRGDAAGAQPPRDEAPAEPPAPRAAADDAPGRPEPVGQPTQEPAERPRSRRGRAKVPSWDEIVFGAKPE